ncbi:hypothetical protein F4782DRAFT_527549 [Xylaria castorea]|nr:hypothetical protein F4782DRAFT_527549 [Xylaria castorea]
MSPYMFTCCCQEDEKLTPGIAVPYEMQAMIFAALSDDPSAIVALAKTCKQFYTIYYNDKEARFKYARDLTNKAVGFYSRTILRLGILIVKFTSCVRRQPEFRDYIIYCREYWEFSARDFEIVRSGKFENEIRKAYQDTRKTQEAKVRRLRKREHKAQNAHGSGATAGVSKRRVNISVGARELEDRLASVFWANFQEHLRPRVSYFDFFCHCGPGFRYNINERRKTRSAHVGYDRTRLLDLDDY